MRSALQPLPTSAPAKVAAERVLRILAIVVADARFAARFRDKFAAEIVLPEGAQLDVPDTLRPLLAPSAAPPK